MKKESKKILNLILPFISVLSIILIWAIASKIVNNFSLLPSITLTLKSFIKLFTYGEFYISFAFTVLRSLIAFVCSFAIAFFVALLSSLSEMFKRAFSPVISVIRVLPTIAVVLLLLVWTNSFVAPVIVVMLVVFPNLVVSLETAFSAVDKEQIEMCKLFGVDEKTLIYRVKIPQMLPLIVEAIGSNLSLSLKLMVAAEVLSYTSQSLGNYLYLSKLYDNTATMMALVMVTVITGMILEKIFKNLSKKFGDWR